MVKAGLESGEVIRGMLADGAQYYAKSIETVPWALDTHDAICKRRQTALLAAALRRRRGGESRNGGSWRWQFSERG